MYYVLPCVVVLLSHVSSYVELCNIQTLLTSFQTKSRKLNFGKTSVDLLRSTLSNINFVHEGNMDFNISRFFRYCIRNFSPTRKMCCDMSSAYFMPQLSAYVT